MKKREKGFLYEEMAKEYLISYGLEFVEQNFYCEFGEIDLIFLENCYTENNNNCNTEKVKKEGKQEERTLIFIEVKYRKNSDFGSPIEVIDKNKIKKIILSSKIYLYRKKWNGNIRFDVIGISGNNKINWIKNAF